jgi:short-subunit dehydrogenase
MKKKNGYFALFIMLIISLTALGISINFSLNNKNEGNKIEIEINKEQKIENIIDITLNPSDVITYKVVTNAQEKTDVKVSIWFEGVDKELDNVLSVYVKYGDITTPKKSIYTYTKLYSLNFTKSLDEDFELIFEMFKDVGNEYQDKKYDFDTYIRAEGK